MLSSERFHFMGHPGGNTCLHGAPAKLEHSSLIGNVNYLGFFRKCIRGTLGVLPFCTLSKARWRTEKGKSLVETINPSVCCLFLVSSTFFWFCDFPFPFSCNITEACVNSYFYDLVHPSHLTCCVLIYPFTSLHTTITLKTWLENHFWRDPLE